MNEPELESLENELRKLSPAKPPEGLSARLYELCPEPPAQDHGPRWGRPINLWRLLRISVLPATGVALLACLLAWQYGERQGARKQPVATAAVEPVSNAALTSTPSPDQEQVEIDHELLSSYETVAELPDVGPVRFRCSEWVDRVVLRDEARGIAIERRTPRFEFVAVGFESY